MTFRLQFLLILTFAGGHRVVKDSLANQLTLSSYKVAPGQKLYPECRKHPAATEDFCFGDEGVVSTETCYLPDDIEAWTTRKIKIEILEQSFELAGVSPVKKHAKHSFSHEIEVKKIYESTHNIMKKNALASLNEPTEQVFPASKVSKKYIR